MLTEMGLVEERHERGLGYSQPVWFLTVAGRAFIAKFVPSRMRKNF